MQPASLNGRQNQTERNWLRFGKSLPPKEDARLFASRLAGANPV
jgi:hypothetical protein